MVTEHVFGFFVFDSQGECGRMIEFEHVTKQYGEFKAVDDLCLTVEKGQICILIGPSGCGKTTTLKMINRLVEATSGVIRIDGQDILSIDPIELRRQIGYVIQEVGLFPHLTAAQNIALVPFLKKWPEKKRRERAEELLELVGLPPDVYRDRYPHELSGGQQQRVGVARALASDPAIILMDEPFGALDPITRTQLQDELLRLQDELHKTIVFVTHDIDEALKLGTMIAVMRAGKVLQYDTPERLLKNPADPYVEEFVGRDRLWRRPEYLKVEDVMIRNPVTIGQHRTPGQALGAMKQYKVNTLLVTSREGRLLGIIRGRDLQRHVERECTMEEIMSSDYATVTIGTGVTEVLALMAERDLELVPVVDEAGKLCGLVTRSSLVNVFAERLFSS